MNRLIRRKFVFYSMTAISILLILLIGAINTINLINTNNMAWNSLEMISTFSDESEKAPDAKKVNPEEKPMKPEAKPEAGSEVKPEANPDKNPVQEPPLQMGRNAYDTYMASNFFIVEYDSDGEVSQVDVSRTSRYTEDEAVEMAEEALASGSAEGRNGKCIYTVTDNNRSDGSSVVFLDVSANKRMVLSVLVASLLAGAGCWILMLLITLLLSRRAVKPIVESFEKQKRFVTDAGHEYKTPLAIIQSNADAMELHVGENKWLTNIKGQVKRLTVLTQDMLLLAKMDEGKIAAGETSVNISEELKQQIAAFGQVIAEKEMELNKEIEENVIRKCSRDDANKLLGILIDNALKYGKHGGSIDISLKKKAGGFTFAIENDCDDLPKVPPEKLFERFYRSDESRNQEAGGCGIGLSIAKSIVENYKGTIKCEYRDGSKIRFTVEM